jgi:DNA-binding CsgD family transcriptional regulator
MGSNEPAFTPREVEVIAQLLEGKANKQIANALGISNRAVEFHLSSIYQKLGVGSRAEAIIRLKDAPLRETAGEEAMAPIREPAVEIGFPPVQNGDHPTPNQRQEMTSKKWIAGIVVIGGILVAVLLLFASNRNPPAPVNLSATPIKIEPQATATTIPTSTLPPPNPTQSIAAVAEEDHARFISETIPDGSTLDPGKSITKTWILENDGTSSWVTDYTLVLTQSSHPLGQTLGEPSLIHLPAEVPPGGKVEISIPLYAPQADAIFSGVYQLHNSAGEWVPGDGGLIWFSLVVGKPVVAAAHHQGVSVELQSIQKDPAYTSATFCAQYPDSQDWNPYPVTLEAGGVSMGLDSYQLLNAKSPGIGASANRCFTLGFPIGTDQYGGGAVAITISSFAVDPSTNLQANCTRAQEFLAINHPGLTFTCGSMGSYYGSIQPAVGMTMEQAQSLVMDVLEQRIYGPWVFEN